MKKLFKLLLLIILLIGVGYGLQTYLTKSSEPQLEPEVNDEVAWEFIKNAEYPNEHTPSSPVKLEDGVAQIESEEGNYTVQVANKRAYGNLNNDDELDAAIVLVTTTPQETVFFDLLAITKETDETAVEVIDSTSLGTDIADGTIHIEDQQIVLRYLETEENYHTPARSVLRIYELDNNKLVLVEEETEEISIRDFYKDHPEKEIVLDNNDEYTDQGTLEDGKIQRYIFNGTGGDQINIKVSSNYDNVILSAFGDDSEEVIVSVKEQLTQINGEIPSSQQYSLLVVPLSGGEIEYTLEIALNPDDQGFQLPQFPSEGSDENSQTPPPQPPVSAGNVIYFTFDDGPHPTFTSQVLDVLKKYDAKATFFPIGQQIEANSAVVNRTDQEGHTFGNHTWDHASMVGMSEEMFEQEVKSTEEALEGKGTNCLRPPGGAMDAYSRAYAAELGYRIVLWDIDPRDWALPGVDAIEQEILTNAGPGKIVLMHDGGGDRSQTIEALDNVLANLSGQGYSFEPYCTL